MAIRGPIYRFQPAGLSDAIIEDFGFPGACQALTNLIPDPGNTNLWVCRPAATKLANLPAGFSSTSFISCLLVTGNLLFGMAASTTFPGFDAPFCYNLLTNAFVSISGITGANIPVSPSPLYAAWSPPQMTVVGIYIVIAHTGYDGITNFVGWINTSNPTAPSYTAGNTATNALPSVPVAVAQFNGRAFYMLNPATGQPAVAASDALLPTTRTNGSFVLTFGDNVPLSGFGYIGLQSPLTGGVVQTLLVFKDDSNIYQITGDFTTTINQNTLNVPTGTASINCTANTPSGTLFVSPDGLRSISLAGTCSPPIGYAGQGVVSPFINIETPSRACAAATGSVYRVSMQNNAASGAPIQEYWYDLNLQRWSGPHSFPASLIAPWMNTFIMTPVGVTGSIWRSDVQPTSANTYIENGMQMTYNFQTSLFADPQALSKINLNEAFVKISAFPLMSAPVVRAIDTNGNILNTASLKPGGAATIWGAFVWGAAIWGGTAQKLIQNKINWTAPITTDECAIQITGGSGAGFKLADLQARVEILGYIPGI